MSELRSEGLGDVGREMPGGSPPAVSILVVAYNSLAHIDECLGAIPAACAQHGYEVLLIDNGDGSTEAHVRQSFPGVRIVESRGNIGFAAGNNLLASHAAADFYLLLNPDMTLSPGAVDALLAASKAHPDAAALGGVSLGHDGKPDTGNALAVPTIAELLSVALGRSAKGSAPIEGLDRDAEVDVVMGGLVLLRKSAWEQAGGLDERFFLYCEEVDLFYRLRKMGHGIWRIPAATGVHDAAHGQAYSPRRQLFRLTGIMEFARHHWSLPRVWLAALLIWVAAVVRSAAGSILGGARPRLRKLGEANRLVALRPGLWFHGYHPERGLMAQLAKNEVKGLQ